MKLGGEGRSEGNEACGVHQMEWIEGEWHSNANKIRGNGGNNIDYTILTYQNAYIVLLVLQNSHENKRRDNKTNKTSSETLRTTATRPSLYVRLLNSPDSRRLCFSLDVVDADDRMVLFGEPDDRSVSVVYALRMEPFVVSDFESSYITWTFRRFRLFWLLYSAVVLSSKYDSDKICTSSRVKTKFGENFMRIVSLELVDF